MDAPDALPEPARQPGTSALTWMVPLAVTLLSFVGVILSVGLRSGALDVSEQEAEEETPAVVATPRRTAAPAVATPARTPTRGSGTVRVSTTNGTAEALTSGNYRVSFSWVLDGAQEGDPVAIRVSSGTQQLAEQRGILGPGSFDPVTATLTLTATGPCSAAGWSAELLSIRDQPPRGDAVARVPGRVCR